MFELFGSEFLNESSSSFVLTEAQNAFMESCDDGVCNFSDAEDALLYLAMENQQNFNDIMTRTAIQEMQYYVEHGEEMVYEAVNIKGFFNKIKEALVKAWTKIKAVFKKVLETISNWTRSDAEYIDKNEDKMRKATGTKINFEGYDINLSYNPFEGLAEASNEVDNVVADMASSVKIKNKNGLTDDQVANEMIKGIKTEDAVKKCLGKIRAFETQKDAKDMTADKYVEYVKKMYGLDKKKTIKTYDAAKCIDAIKNAKEYKKKINEDYDLCKKLFAMMISGCDKEARELSKSGEASDRVASKGASVCSQVYNKLSTLAHSAQQIGIKAVNVAHSQAKAMTSKAISAARKAGTMNESALDDVDFDLI